MMDKKDFSILLLSTVLAAFVGAFLASFIVLGRHPKFESSFMGAKTMEPSMSPSFEEYFNNPDRFMEKQQDFIDKFNNDFEDSIEKSLPKAGFVYFNNSGLKTQETKDAYKITIDLRPFNNDAKNVKFKLDDNRILISAQYKSNDKKNFNSAQFHQEMILPSKIEEDKITQQKKGNFLIITVPKDHNDD